MRRVWALAASTTGLVIGTGSISQNQEKSRGDSLQRRIEKTADLIQRHMVINGIPGVSIAVSVDGKTVLSRGFGYSDIESGASCTEDTVMRIASISKPVTATLAARLVQEGKLDLNKPIQEYLPGFPKKTFNNSPVNITTRQLLCHTGGIRHYEKKNGNGNGILEDPSSNNTSVKEFLSNKNYASVTEALEMFKDDDLVAEPGKEFNYTTHGLTLVSAVLEKVSGKTYPQLFKQLCFQLELRNTHLDTNKRVIPNRASYYVRRNGALENCQEVDNSYKWAGGGLLSNVGDLLSFANCYLKSFHSLNEAFLKKSVLEEFWQGDAEIPRDPNTRAGLGFMRVDNLEGRERSSRTLWYHTGAAVGASSILLIRPTQSEASSDASGICIVMLCNLQDTSLYSLAFDIEAIFHDYQVN